ncbi:MAG: sulfatase [Spirochaetia bacterium]|nr:sulfatase [Spirochaetia bacterium]
MKAVLIMYDSLNKRYLPPYGNNKVVCPNFTRLAQCCNTYDNFYAGSLPCIPARREIHTGRYNFLHRSWSPGEPFDESMPELLSQAGIYTHLITDHCHYWENGGLNYNTRFTTHEYIRGQEGDAWAGTAKDFTGNKYGKRQDSFNRLLEAEEKDHSHVRCFEKGRQFLYDNKDNDNWFLQLEYFDPHEPFFAPDRFKKLYTDSPNQVDWPEYRVYTEAEQDMVDSFQTNYSAVVSMCDEYLGKILDVFDELDLWKDTLLIINTDHGFMLGEKGFVGKNYMPVFDDIANLPFFMYVPGEEKGKRRKSLCQTIDIAPTLLDWFGMQKGKHMLGKSLLETNKNDRSVHECILYGYFGMHVNITDGKYTYHRCAKTKDNTPLFQYTLEPAHIKKFMSKEEIKQADMHLHDEFTWTDHVPVMKIPVDERYDRKKYYTYSNHAKYGDLLFDRVNDPEQLTPLHDEQIEQHFTAKMVSLMKENEAPEEQYVRLGLQK